MVGSGKESGILAVIAKNLSAIRHAKGMTQEQLAIVSGVGQGDIQQCEAGRGNLPVEVLYKIALVLDIDIARMFVDEDNIPSPKIDRNFIRTVPLPLNLTCENIVVSLQKTHNFFTIIRRTSNINLAGIIQGNNFSGIVSNVFTRMLAENSLYKEFSEQRYPDLIGPDKTGLEVKATVNAWKGGEGHNGHSGWHIILCYNILESGDIEIVQVEIAELIGYGCPDADWKYQGSRRNANESQRTETYVTTGKGTAKLRDGSLYLRTDILQITEQMIAHRRALAATLPIPDFSPFFAG